MAFLVSQETSGEALLALPTLQKRLGAVRWHSGLFWSGHSELAGRFLSRGLREGKAAATSSPFIGWKISGDKDT